MNSSKNRKNYIRKISTSAILSALTSILLLMGSVLEIMDMSCSAIASFAILVTLLEFGGKTAFSVYVVSSVLSFIIMPLSSAVIYFALLFGYFPILKFYADMFFKNKKIISFLLKFFVFNLSCFAIIFIFTKIYGLDAMMSELEWGFVSKNTAFVAIFLLLNIFLLMYDKLLFFAGIIYKNLLRKKIFPKN